MPLFVGQIVTTPVFPHQCIPYSSAEMKTENFYFCNIFSPSRVLLPAGGNQTSKDVETSIASAVTIVLIILFAKKYLRKEQLHCSTQNATRRTSVQWASFSKGSTVTPRKLPLALLVGKKRKKEILAWGQSCLLSGLPFLMCNRSRWPGCLLSVPTWDDSCLWETGNYDWSCLAI